MAIVMMLMGLAQNVWQFLALRSLTPPRCRALGTLSTGAVSGTLIGPLIGGLLADLYGLRLVFFITALVLLICFITTVLFAQERFTPVPKKDMLSGRQVLASLKNPRLGKLGDRVSPEHILISMMALSVLLLIPMSFVQAPWQLGLLRFLLGATDGALLPAVQTLLIYNSSSQVAGRIFSYNQSFRDVGNVSGPLLGAFISASYGFRAVFFVTALVVMFNVCIPGGVCSAARHASNYLVIECLKKGRAYKRHRQNRPSQGGLTTGCCRGEPP